jgi:hypothetical protein
MEYKKPILKDNIDAQIVQLKTEYRTTMGEFGLDFNLYEDQSLDLFNKLTLEQQHEIVRRYSNMLDIYMGYIPKMKESKSTELSSKDEISMLKNFFFKFRLTPPMNENFAFLKKGMVIEVYSLQMKQIYRNIEFHRHCKYDPLLLEVVPWMNLYKRDDKITEMMMTKAMDCFASQRKESMDWNIPTHIIMQKNSKDYYQNDYVKLVPLKSEGKVVAAINIVDSKFLGSLDDQNAS